jgi:cysteine-rich repeat protein
LTGTTSCISCPAGTYSATIGANSSSTCIPCVAGKFSSVVGAGFSSVCTNCPAGTYSSIIGADSSATCMICPAGTYSATIGANSFSTCIPCIVGTWSNISGATLISTCQSCPAGFYSGTLGANSSSTCIPCANGFYSSSPGWSICSACTTCVGQQVQITDCFPNANRFCRLPVCQNGVLEGPEECDDGNPFNGDGCSTTCTIEDPTGSQWFCSGDNLATTICCPPLFNPVLNKTVCTCAGQVSVVISPLYIFGVVFIATSNNY